MNSETDESMKLDPLQYGVHKTTQALLFAIRAHHGQMRKYGEGNPYIMHPIRVAERVRMRYGETPEGDTAVCAAYLHDVIEDCGVPQIDLLRIFGSGVSSLVGELTNPSKGMNETPRAIRRQIDRERIAKASTTAKFIKLVDRIDNLMEIESAETDFKALYAKESLLLLDVLRGTDEALEGVLRNVCISIVMGSPD